MKYYQPEIENSESAKEISTNFTESTLNDSLEFAAELAAQQAWDGDSSDLQN